MNPYRVLGVRATANHKEIKCAYYRLVQELHPDKIVDQTQKKLSQQKFIKVTEAYKLLQSGRYQPTNSYNPSTYNHYTNRNNTTDFESIHERERRIIFKGVRHGIVIGLLSFGYYTYVFVNVQKLKSIYPNHPLVKLILWEF